MKVLEVKNNLVKIEYAQEDGLLLAGFVVIEDMQTPYVAQILSLKADKGMNYAIVKLLFTFNDEGILKNYNGSIPSLDAEVTILDARDLLDILPINNPVDIGNLAHQNVLVKVDMSIFEKNLLICSDNYENTNILLENLIYQLNEKNYKSILFDADNAFEDTNKLKFGEDFKLPLNYETINYIYEHDLGSIDPSSKAIIQDIFLEIQEYSKTVLDKFIPFDDFLAVVDNQYKVLGIPELVLLKNKLLRYKEMNVFAQTPKEIHNLKSAIRANLCNIIDISTAEDSLQNEIIRYVYDTIDEMDLFVYSFVPLNNENADKKLIRHFLTKSKIYSSVICSHNFKYIYELKERANNYIMFTPLTMQHDFSVYNTFLNKLNPDEFIIYGKSTQNMPLIIELASMFKETEDEVEDVIENSTTEASAENLQEEPKADDFAEESNSYSYETLIEDTAEPIQEEHTEEEVQEEATQEVVEAEPVEQEAPEKSETDNEEEEEEEEVINVDMDDNSETEEEYEEYEEEESVLVEESEDTVDTETITNIIDKEIEAETYTSDDTSDEEIIEGEYTDLGRTSIESSIEESSLDMQEDANLELPPIEEEHSEIQEDMEPLSENMINEAPEDTEELNYAQAEQSLPSIDDIVEQDEDDTNDNLTEADLNFIQDVNSPVTEDSLPVYPAETPTAQSDDLGFAAGDHVSHPKYGEGIIEKIIRYGSKSLCSISFMNVGRRLLDPAISEITKLSN